MQVSEERNQLLDITRVAGKQTCATAAGLK